MWDKITENIEIQYEGKIFVIAGVRDVDKIKIAQFIRDQGGRVQSSVSVTTDYLVVTPLGDHETLPYKRALEMIEKGKDIVIITSYEMLNNLENAIDKNKKDIINDFAIKDGVLEAYSGYSEHVVIPFGVKKIGPFVFSTYVPENPYFSKKNNNKYIRSIFMPDSVTEIDDGAFYDCSNLQEITLSKKLIRIGNYAFHNCSNLRNLSIPDSITSIGHDAFGSCSKLIYSIHECAGRYGHALCLGNATNPYLVVVRTTFYDTIPKTTKIIYSHAYQFAHIKNLIIPNGVTQIGAYAFMDCSELISVTIPDSVTSIGKNAFSGCSKLERIITKNIDILQKD